MLLIRILVICALLVIAYFIVTQDKRSATDLLNFTDINFVQDEKIAPHEISYKIDDKKPLDQARCNNTFNSLTITRKWRNQKRRNIIEAFFRFKQAGQQDFYLDQLAHLSGISPYWYRYFLDMKGAYSAILPNSTVFVLGEKASNKDQVLFYKLIENNQVETLKEALTQGKIANDKRYKNNNSVLTEILHSHLDDRFLLVEYLVNNGVLVQQQDLYYATRFNAPLTVIERLYEEYKQSVDFVWFRSSDYSLQSLTIAAVEQNNPELVKFWLAAGSPLSPNTFYENALDKLNMPTGESEKARSLAIFSLLMAEGLSPVNPDSSDKLIAWLPEKELTFFRSQLQSKDQVELPNGWLKKLSKQQDDLYHILLAGLEVDETIGENCFKYIGKKLAKEMLAKNAPNSSSSKEITQGLKKSLIKIEDKQKPTIQSFLGEEVDISTIHDIEVLDDLISMLEGKTSLADKQLLTQLIQRKSSLEAKEAFESMASNLLPNNDKNKKAFQKAIEFAREGDFSNAKENILALETESGLEKQDHLDQQLVLAISFNASFTEIKGLLTAGARPIDMLLPIIIDRNDVALLKLMTEYGLDINYQSSSGMTGVSLSVIKNAPNLLEFLLQNGAPVKPDGYALDSLDHALALASNNPVSYRIITQLMNYNAPVELSHREKLNQLKFQELALYNRLVKDFPELKL